MSPAEYNQAIDICRAMGTLANSVDFAAAIDAAERADAIGPILDPTLYRNAMDTHHLIKRGLRAARNFQTEMLAIEAGFQENKARS